MRENEKSDERALTVGERVADSIRELTTETAALELYTENMKKKRRPTARAHELSTTIKSLESGFVVKDNNPKRKRRMK